MYLTQSHQQLRAEIEADIAAFLKKGGGITKYPSHVMKREGNVKRGPQPIVYSKASTQRRGLK